MNIHSQFFGFIFVILFTDLASCSQPNQQPLAATQTPASALANPTICAEIGQSRVSPIDGMTQVCVPAG
jgi:hypothetical protein